MRDNQATKGVLIYGTTLVKEMYSLVPFLSVKLYKLSGEKQINSHKAE